MAQNFDFLDDRVREILEEMGIREPTPPQLEASPLIAAGKNVLVVAPTGSGKTEAAILPLLSRVVKEGHGDGISIIYITPLRALNRDILRRLESWCAKLSLTVEVRHGDTPQAQRQRQSRTPPDLLVTTPETLQAILPGSRMRANLSTVKAVVVDELHNLVESKRGVQLTMGLERLKRVTGEIQLVGLSATIGSPEEAAKFLFGSSPHVVVKAAIPKEFGYRVVYPTPDSNDGEVSRETFSTIDLAARLSEINSQIDGHRSTLIFVNSRTLAEMLGEKLNRMRGDVGVHHGSLPREERERVENAFKAGALKALVCIPEDEFIVTSRGVKQAKEVGIGDDILSYDLNAMRTTFKPVVRKYERVASGFLEIKHEIGTLRVTPNHPVLCFGAKGLSWKPAEEIKEGEALVTVGRIQGESLPTHKIANYPNLFVKNSAVRALGYEPPGKARSKVTRFNSLKTIMNEKDLERVTEYRTTQATYKLPPKVDARLGYLLGFMKSDGDRYMRFFNSDSNKIARVQEVLSEIYDGTPYKLVNEGSKLSTRPQLVLHAHSKPLTDLFANMWKTLPLQEEVVAALLAAYLDGDGCIVVRDDGRVEQIQFVTFKPENREHLLFNLLSLGFKPKLWKANGASGSGFCISVVYKEEKRRLLELVKKWSLKASDLNIANFGNKGMTYYGLGEYIKQTRQGLGLSSYSLFRKIGYSTKYENRKRGITKEVLAKVNMQLHSSLLESLMLGKFGVSKVRSIRAIKNETRVVNFEVEGTQNYAVGGVVTHNCTSTLELGIDVGSVDVVIQYMSPRQVTSLIQRVGRSGHSLSRRSEGVLITVSADDVLESAASIEEAQRGRLEETRPYRNSLDVLAHQIAGYLMDYGSMEKGALLREVRRAYPYSELGEDAFQRVIDYLAQIRKLRVEGTRLVKNGATREYYFQNLSMIPDETRYYVVDVANNQSVGILGMEFILLQARVGLHFILKGKVWQIEKITDDRKVYVTSVEDPLAAVPGWDGEMMPVPFGLAQKTGSLRKRVAELLSENEPERTAELLAAELPVSVEGTRMVVDEIHEHLRLGAPLPSEDLILFEGWQKYLIIHSCFGENINRTLAYTFEEVLSRKGLIRLWYMDGYRIMMELTAEAADLDLKALASELFSMTPEEFEKTYATAAQRNFPFPGRVKVVAERFGALRKGQFIAHPNLCSLPTRFENTPIFEETLQETGRDLLDLRRVKELLVSVASGGTRVETYLSEEKPTPIAYHILYRYLDVPELVAPDSLAKTTMERMKLSIFGTSVGLVCMKCGQPNGNSMIGEIAEEPRCSACGSGLLAPSFWTAGQVAKLARMKLGHQTLSEEERSELAKARRSADLVLSYGRRAIIAQAVYGVGPQTAGRILARMEEDEESFYRELLEAKLKFITTRPFW